MNNKIIVFFAAVFIMLSVVGLASADSNPCLPVIKMVNQDPSPAVPNEYVKVLFQITGLGNCNGFAIKLNPEYPFSLDNGTNPIQVNANNPFFIGTASPDYSSDWVVPYKIRVAQDALEGDYNLKLLYHEGTNTNFDSSAIGEFNISVVDSQTNFDVVIQGISGSQVSLGIVNTGKNTANSVIVGIPQQASFRATGTNQQIVGNLAAGDYTLVSFNLASTRAVNSSVARGIPRNFGNMSSAGQNLTNAGMLNVQIDYTDGIGERRSVIKEISAGSIISQSSGNFSSSSIRRTTTTSKISFWWYILGIIIVIVLMLVYRKYQEEIKAYFGNSKKKTSYSIPDWVLKETRRRK